MSKYLVVNFDRYDASNSTQEFVTAGSHKQAIIRVLGDINDDEFIKYVGDMMVKTSDDFASLSEEESDVLSYLIPQFD